MENYDDDVNSLKVLKLIGGRGRGRSHTSFEVSSSVLAKVNQG